MSVILATQEAEIRRIVVQSQPGQIVHQTLSRKKSITKIGLVEWLKVKTLTSSPSTTKKKKKAS
jgi:ribosomal protein S21